MFSRRVKTEGKIRKRLAREAARGRDTSVIYPARWKDTADARRRIWDNRKNTRIDVPPALVVLFRRNFNMELPSALYMLDDYGGSESAHTHTYGGGREDAPATIRRCVNNSREDARACVIGIH